MEEWGKPPPSAPPPRRPPVGEGAGVQPPAPRVGFGAAFNNLAARKLRELRGRRWEGAAERARSAEANRRAAAELARRIERQTGSRPKESTIRRAAREDRTPRGVDQTRLDRQARIDAAGGVKGFAARAGVPASRVGRWRDSGAPLAVGGARVAADVDGVLWANDEPYPRSVSVVLDVTQPASDEIRAAYAAGDLDALAELLGPLITETVDWAGDADRRFEVQAITQITVTWM